RKRAAIQASTNSAGCPRAERSSHTIVNSGVRIIPAQRYGIQAGLQKPARSGDRGGDEDVIAVVYGNVPVVLDGAAAEAAGGASVSDLQGAVLDNSVAVSVVGEQQQCAETCFGHGEGSAINGVADRKCPTVIADGGCAGESNRAAP